jgi:hypothetical protein
MAHQFECHTINLMFNVVTMSTCQHLFECIFVDRGTCAFGFFVGCFEPEWQGGTAKFADR